MFTKTAFSLFHNPAKDLTPEEDENLRWYHEDAPDRDIVKANRNRGIIGAALGAIPGAVAGGLSAWKGRPIRGALWGAGLGTLGAYAGARAGMSKYSPDTAQDIIYGRKHAPTMDEIREAAAQAGFTAGDRRTFEELYKDDERARINALSDINAYRRLAYPEGYWFV